MNTQIHTHTHTHKQACTCMCMYVCFYENSLAKLSVLLDNECQQEPGRRFS